MKIKLSIIVIAVSLLNGALAFVVTWNFIIGLAATAIFLFIGLCLIIQLIVGYLEKERKRHESYRFVNGFLITLSVSKSPEEAFQSGLIGGGPELLAIAQSVGDYSVGDRLEYLKSYFLEPYYLLLVSLFALFEEQGGDPLALGQSLLEEATRSEKSDDEKGKRACPNSGNSFPYGFSAASSSFSSGCASVPSPPPWSKTRCTWCALRSISCSPSFPIFFSRWPLPRPSQP